MLVGLGTLLIIVGLVVWLVADKLSWFGRLPGDIRIARPGFQLYAPLMTSLLLSVGLTLAFWLFNKFFRLALLRSSRHLFISGRMAQALWEYECRQERCTSPSAIDEVKVPMLG